MGQLNIMSTGTSLKMPSVTPSIQPSPTAVVDLSIVQNLAALLAALSATMGAGDANKNIVFLSSVSLKNLRPNASGKYDADGVVRAINVMPPALQAWVSQALGSTPQMLAGQPYANSVAALQSKNVTSLALLLAGIPAGRYSGTVTTASAPAKTTLLAALKLLPVTTVATAKPVAPKLSPKLAADVPNPQKDVLCADGYYRDASGMCVAQPVAQQPPSQQPAAVQQAAAAQAQPAADQTTVDSATAPSPSDLVVPAEVTPLPAATVPTSNVPWLYIGIGAAGVAAVGLFMMNRGSRSTPNRRRKSASKRAKNRGRKRARRHSRRS